MAAKSASDLSESAVSTSRLPTSVPSSPPSESSVGADDANDGVLLKEEQFAKAQNERAEEKRRQALIRKRKKKPPETKAEREAKARELDELLMKSAAFSDILTKKTQVLGRVGSGLDGKTLGEHDLQMAKQPKCLVGGTMRDYQLEGLTWMYEICSQGMSGILADEMGLGKTVQTISLIALLREQENYLGPHLIVAPLSTLSNWMDEFKQWTPSIPVVMYHGNKDNREEIFKRDMMKHLNSGRPTTKFPVNNLKELWSLLHFLLPNIFTDWDAFESWFDFSDLEDEKGTQEFIGDQMKQDLVKKIHLILQPMLLRRVKSDVAAYLPKKREYVLFAPMTKEQTDLYNVLGNKKIDSREYLENKVFEMINSTPTSTRASRDTSRSASIAPTPKRNTATPKTMSLPVRESPRKKQVDDKTSSPATNAFSMMMGKRGRGRPRKNPQPDSLAPVAAPETPATKRKAHPSPAVSAAKSARSSRQSTPAGSRGLSRKRGTYKEAGSDEEDLSDDEFEAKLAKEIANDDSNKDDKPQMSIEELERAQTLELASRSSLLTTIDPILTATEKQIAQKKLGNPLAQLRLVCNSPHNFYNPWATETDVPVDDSIVTSSGKMLLLDRLLPALFKEDHKVLIFSQFTTQLDILEDYCSELRGWKVCRIDGSVSQESRRVQIRDFNTDPGYKIFLLSTRAGGQGINLASADTVILFDSDFNPQQDLQAQDRCHRIGQTRPVIVYRLATKDTVEESLLLAANAKRRLEKLVIKKGGFKTMGQKRDLQGDLDPESLKALLLKDGEVYKLSGGDQILSDDDLKVLCDRSEAAYVQAASGEGDADGYRVVETGADSIKMARKD
ncbi:hypothetical protein G7Z17_g2826 [Cylindrodendrum hubeiense]|uniref:Helicase C-terminal domain-containing protein n=1 Tax=Cylindrodendrum hubeiense TaxID=595255 RepID=A0A9P5LIR2_9HYPO|nr:hypothetical protein G7Z17_g2826 [Cylindrodendrum hubeiense]